MRKWARNIKTVQDERIKLAIIAANNHYAGFGPGTAMYFGLSWDYQKPNGKTGKGGKSKSNPTLMTSNKVRFLIFELTLVSNLLLLDSIREVDYIH